MKLKIDWVGSVLGLSGAALLAVNQPYSGYGFVCFLMSNACWIVHAIRTKTHSLLMMQAGFTLTSLIGVWRWLV